MFKSSHFLLFISLSVAFFACGTRSSSSGQADYFGVFGDSTITEDGAIETTELFAKLQTMDSVNTKVAGKIERVCQAKGCWMSMSLSADKAMTVRFDYAFFVPKNSSGRDAIIEGIAYVDTISVIELQHLAEDDNKTPEEIAKITQPEITYAFTATGVIIK